MSFTMVATDFDDTLVPIGALLSERNRAALDRVRAKGITTVIASGRTSHGLFTQLDRNQVDTQGLYLIGYNGALACRLFGQPERPAVCSSLSPEAAMCGSTREQAMVWLGRLERLTEPGGG